MTRATTAGTEEQDLLQEEQQRATLKINQAVTLLQQAASHYPTMCKLAIATLTDPTFAAVLSATMSLSPCKQCPQTKSQQPHPEKFYD